MKPIELLNLQIIKQIVITLKLQLKHSNKSNINKSLLLTYLEKILLILTLTKISIEKDFRLHLIKIIIIMKTIILKKILITKGFKLHSIIK